jgi:hypothetical protein
VRVAQHQTIHGKLSFGDGIAAANADWTFGDEVADRFRAMSANQCASA